MESHRQGTTWWSPSLSRSNAWPLSSSWNPSAHQALRTVKISAQWRRIDTRYFTHNWETRGGRERLIPSRTGPKDLPTPSMHRDWFPWGDIGSDHDLLMMTFHLRRKGISKPKHTRLKFDLEKLKNPNVLETCQAMIGGKFAPLTIMYDEYTDMDSMIITFKTQHRLKEPVKFLANVVRRRKPVSLQKFLICATKG